MVNAQRGKYHLGDSVVTPGKGITVIRKDARGVATNWRVIVINLAVVVIVILSGLFCILSTIPG
jgi:hypothetical protein